MPTKGYTVLGWVVWQVLYRAAKLKLGQNKAKLGAAATVLAVLGAGVISRRAPQLQTTRPGPCGCIAARIFVRCRVSGC